MSDKLVLIDGHSILNRAYYGIPDLTNSEGFHTNAIYGFLNIMFMIVDAEKPQYLIVTFDEHAPTFRHEMYAAYKGTRKPMDEELRQQVPVMRQVLELMGVKVISKPGLEADDLMGTLAKEAERKGMEVSLVSGDRDLLQIASDHIKIRIPKTKRTGTEIEDYYAADVREKYQLTPLQFIELKALMGDTADNIPGVPKVGEKTATDLMVTYGSIASIYEHLEEIKKNAVRESLRENKELAELSLKLATIKTDCELPLHPEDAALPDFYTPEAYELFRKLELKSFYARFDNKVSTAAETDIETEAVFAKDAADSEIKINALAGDGRYIAVRIYPTEGDDFVLSVAGEDKEKTLFADSKDTGAEALKSVLKKYMDNGGHIIAYDVKPVYAYLGIDEKTLSKDASASLEDMMLAAYLLNPLKGSYPIEETSNAYLHTVMKGYAEIFGKKTPAESYASDKDVFIDRASKESAVLFRLYEKLKAELVSEKMYDLYRDIEMPLSYVLYKMESEGIKASAEALAAYSKELESTIDTLEKRIWLEAGQEFNINSPKQLGVILFEQMKLPGGKKTKTGYSTAADVLEKLAADHPFVNDILEYRTYTKLKSTYADGLAQYIRKDGRIHTSFNQTITATGRLSSTEPNLQNIPMRYELGRQIRKVFTPKEGYIFADADYSQIELRILASLAGDQGLIEAYRSEEDIHRITASKVFNIPFEEVTDLQRRNAKAVNFGIVYGISSFGLSEGLSITRKEAAQYIEDYFKTYPAIKEYLDSVKDSAKKTGYSVTAFGRRRPIPELKASEFMRRQFGERVAMNAPIQGTAADVIKIAMIRVYDRLVKEELKSRLLLQIHDELLIEAAEDEKEKVLEILREEMQGAADFPVKLTVDAHTGKDWYEAK